MKVCSINNYDTKRNTCFTSKLPSIKALYTKNNQDFVVDFWPEFTKMCLNSKRDTRLFDLLKKLSNNFDNHVLGLTYSSNRKYGTDELFKSYTFRLYKDTDELIANASNSSNFYKNPTNLNSSVEVWDFGNTNTVNKIVENIDGYGFIRDIGDNVTEALLTVLSRIVTPKTTEYKAIYKNLNTSGEESILNAFRSKN